MSLSSNSQRELWSCYGQNSQRVDWNRRTAAGPWYGNMSLIATAATQGRRPDHVLTQRHCDCALDPNLAHSYQVQCRRTYVRPAVLLLFLNLKPCLGVTACHRLFDLGGHRNNTDWNRFLSLAFFWNIYEEKKNYIRLDWWLPLK